VIIKCHRVISMCTGKDLGNDAGFLKIGNQYLVFCVRFVPKKMMQVMIQSEPEDGCCPFWVDLRGFEVIDNYIPKDWIHVYNPEFSSMKVMPASWNYPNFLEDLSNDEPHAVALFHQEAAKLADNYPLL
jgi:hypothetical protein